MVNDLKCQTCLKQYAVFQKNPILSSYQDLPLLLVCGHTFCQKCLTQIYNKQKGIFCPVCGEFTECSFDKKAGIKGLYPHICALGYSALSNVNLIDKVTTLMDSSNMKKILLEKLSLQHCSECMQHAATVNCIQCGVNICDECFQTIHQNSRVLQRHQAISVKKSAHNLSSLDCSRHHSLTNFYCVDDETFVCHECIDQDHHNHEIISLRQKSEQVAPKVKESLKNVCIIMSKLESYIFEIEHEINDIFNEVKKKENDILTCFLEITGKIQSNFLMLMDDLEKVSYFELKQLFKLRDTAHKELSNLHLLSEDAQLIINSSEEIESFVVDPVKTLNSLKRAAECHCVFEKVPLHNDYDTDDYERKKTADRFFFLLNKNVVENAKDWGTLKDIKQFNYTSKPFDDFDHEIVSNADSSSEMCSILSATINDVSKNKSTLNNEKMMVVKVPPAQNQELVFVTLVSSPDDFFIQRHNDRSQLSEMEQKLKVMSYLPASDNQLSCICLGDLCTVCISNKKWYRAKVSKIFQAFDVCNRNNDASSFVAYQKDEVELFLIDFGKTTKAKVSCLRTLPNALQHIPPLAIPCSLVGIRPIGACGSWSEKAVQMFARMVANRPVLMTTRKRESGRRFVDLHKPAADEIDGDIPVSVRDALVFMHFAKFSGDSNTINLQWENSGRIKHRDYFCPTVLSLRSCVNVVLSHYNSISKFFVQQLGSNTVYLESLSEKIQNFVNQKLKKGSFDPASPFTVLKPFVNMPCLAKYDCCNMWFRAKILQVMKEEYQVQVFYVDYGNDAIVDVKDLLKIPNEFMKLPYQGLECKLADVTPPNGVEKWSKESLDRFFELVGEEQVKMMIRSYDNNVYSVELFDWTDGCRIAANDLSINERLVHEGLACGLTVHKVVDKIETSIGAAGDNDSENNCNETIKDVSNSEFLSSHHQVVTSKTFEVTVILCLSPALFYTQSDTQWQMCNQLTRELNSILQSCDSNQSTTLLQGDHCAVHSPTERRWCRAVIQEVGEEDVPMCAVHLVDFGLTEIVPLTSIQPLPDELKKEKPQCTPCFIVDVQPAGGNKWSYTALNVFKEMVHKKKCSLLPADEASADARPLPVKLFVPTGVDEDVEVGRELILRGVALPVFRLDFLESDSKPAPHPLSRIQQEFERSEAAYREAENVRLPERSSTPLQFKESTTFPNGHQEERNRPNISQPTCFITSAPQSDSHEVGKTDNSGSPIHEHDLPSASLLPDVKTSFEKELLRIPFSDILDTSSSFDCVVSHIEKYNLFYIKKAPVERVLPEEKNFVSKLSQLKTFDPGTPCLARFDEDDRWYRAEVLEVQKEVVSVFYVDYGLTQVITDLDRLLILPEQFAKAPRLAAACFVPSMPSIMEASLPEEQYLSVLAKLIGKKRYTCSVIESLSSVPPAVNLLYKEKGGTTPLADLFVEALALLDYKTF